jgi:Domain of unknown function (DUF4160)
MFFNDHAPPHFHARYGEFEATISLGTLEVIQGALPARALSMVKEWGMIHREELLNGSIFAGLLFSRQSRQSSSRWTL